MRFFVAMPPHSANLDAKERGNYSVIPPALKTGTNGAAEESSDKRSQHCESTFNCLNFVEFGHLICFFLS